MFYVYACSWLGVSELTRALGATWIEWTPDLVRGEEAERGHCEGTRANGGCIFAAAGRFAGPDHAGSGFGAASLAPGFPHRVPLRLRKGRRRAANVSIHKVVCSHRCKGGITPPFPWHSCSIFLLLTSSWSRGGVYKILCGTSLARLPTTFFIS